jgi:hypothetical protein
MNSSTRTPTGAISDEEIAKRLTEMLKLLDAMPPCLPDTPASRRLLDEAAAAAEPLGILLGYFIGGLNPDPSR